MKQKIAQAMLHLSQAYIIQKDHANKKILISTAGPAVEISQLQKKIKLSPELCMQHLLSLRKVGLIKITVQNISVPINIHSDFADWIMQNKNKLMEVKSNER